MRKTWSDPERRGKIISALTHLRKELRKVQAGALAVVDAFGEIPESPFTALGAAFLLANLEDPLREQDTHERVMAKIWAQIQQRQHVCDALLCQIFDRSEKRMKGVCDINPTSTVSGGFSPISGSKVFVLSNRSSQRRNSDELY